MVQEELEQLKRFVSADEGEIVSLRGLWKGADVTDEEIANAKRSLFKGIEIDDSP